MSGKQTPTVAIKDLAKAIEMAAELREHSYNDRIKEYQIGCFEAIDEAIREVDIDSQLAGLIYTLLSTAWDEALDWSAKTRKKYDDEV